MARVKLWVLVVAWVLGWSAAAVALDRSRLENPTPLSEVEMGALLQRVLGGRPGVTRLSIDSGDVALFAGGQAMRFGIAPLTRQMNAMNGARARQTALDSLIRRVDETVAGPQQPRPELEREQFRRALIPVLKNKALIAECRAKQCGPGKGGDLLHRRFAGDIVVVAALDLPEITRFVRVGEGGAFGMKDEDVFKLAFDNLSRRAGKLQLLAFGPVRFLDFEDDYNASLLLVPAMWKSVPGLPRKVAVAVPSRDVVAFADADDRKALEALRGVAKMDDKGFPVSRLLFLRTERGLEVMP